MFKNDSSLVVHAGMKRTSRERQYLSIFDYLRNYRVKQCLTLSVAMVNVPCTRYHVLGTLRPSHKIPEDLPYPSVFGSVISNQERTSSFYTLAQLHMRTVSIIYMSICNERKLNYMFYARQLIKRLLRGAQVDFLSVYTWAMKCNVL